MRASQVEPASPGSIPGAGRKSNTSWTLLPEMIDVRGYLLLVPLHMYNIDK